MTVLHLQEVSKQYKKNSIIPVTFQIKKENALYYAVEMELGKVHFLI